MGKLKPDVTELLTGAADPARVAEQLMPIVYAELRILAAGMLKKERKAHTLQPTALVHEAFLRLVDQSRVNWQGRTHFFSVGAAMMRRILVDHARSRGRQKRGGNRPQVSLESGMLHDGEAAIDVLEVHDALEALAAVDPEQSRIVELRFFGGLTVEEVSQLLGVSKRKVEDEWTHAKAWLRSRFEGDNAR